MLDDEKRKVIEAEDRLRHELRLQLEAEAAKFRAEAGLVGAQLKQAEALETNCRCCPRGAPMLYG